MPLPVKFADVSVSLKQFQDISSGRHNAGEVRLKDAHTIDKVNHYVSRTGRNKVSLSHAEVIAVKQAFVDALARGGVQADEIAKVRAQLGLAPEKAVDTQLMERSLRPLSRQQIREILDRNAEALNAGQNEVTIRTSAQIYARVGADTRRRRIAERDAANAGLAESRKVETQRRFSLFQSLLAGDVDFRSKADRAELLQMAKEALGIVLDLSNGHPRADRQAKISWGSNGERRFTMEAGTDEATFARRLEDMIVRLSGLGPGADAIELRAAFRAVPRGERSRWIDALVRDGGDKTPYKVRTLCVALLQDAGVDDYESLSFPNRLPDAAATSLLRELAALPEGASAERARQCLDMARDLADDGMRANLAYVPATSAEAFNDDFLECMGSISCFHADLKQGGKGGETEVAAFIRECGEGEVESVCAILPGEGDVGSILIEFGGIDGPVRGRQSSLERENCRRGGLRQCVGNGSVHADSVSGIP